MTDKDIIEFLREPYADSSKRMLCGCGNLQTHKLRWCSDCGGEYNLDPTKVTRVNVINMQCTYNPYRRRDGGKDGYRWWEAIFRRRIGGRVGVKKFQELCKKA